jgi:hypothetical protein
MDPKSRLPVDAGTAATPDTKKRPTGFANLHTMPFPIDLEARPAEPGLGAGSLQLIRLFRIDPCLLKHLSGLTAIPVLTSTAAAVHLRCYGIMAPNLQVPCRHGGDVAKTAMADAK